MKVSDLFTQEEENAIVAAIGAAEQNTSGEIRVHIEATRKGKETLDRAIEVFQELKMHQTEARNGVLIYLAYEDHAFSIFGDQGINEKVPPGFWDTTRDLMEKAFKRSAFAEGLIAGIGEAGRALKVYFPYQSNDQNELDDSISKG
jgi:uncharacterized membrane protein